MATCLLLTRCYYDSEEELYINITDNCTIDDYSYTSGVQPIMQANCLGCHGSSYASSGGGIDLRTYSNVKANITNILKSIKYESGVSPMPKNSSKLSDCNISVIELWNTNSFPQ
jgi:mono/diheme cytochrome c family protein